MSFGEFLIIELGVVLGMSLQLLLLLFLLGNSFCLVILPDFALGELACVNSNSAASPYPLWSEYDWWCGH